MKVSLTTGYAVSLVLHAVLILPFLPIVRSSAPDTPEILALDLSGVESDVQNEQQTAGTKREVATAAPNDTAQPPPPEPVPQPPIAPEPRKPEAPKMADPPPPPVVKDVTPPPPEPVQASSEAIPAAPAEPATTKPTEVEAPPRETPARDTPPVPPAATAAAESTPGADADRQAHALAREKADAAKLEAYVKGLTQRVQRNLLYPAAGRKTGLKGTARVAFTLGLDGRILPGSLRIAESSGQEALDDSALRTIRESAPFDAPPQSMMIVISLNYGRRS